MILNTSDFASSLAQTVYNEEFLSVYLRTMRVGIIVVLFATLLAYPLAYYVSRSRANVKSFFKAIIFLPLMVNPLIRAFGWIIILGREGIVNSFLAILGFTEPLRLLFTEFAMELGLLELFFPFMFIPLLSAMENLDEEVLMSARSLGAGGLRTFINIIFPLTLKGYVLGVSVILAGCASAFITPSLLGSVRNETLSMLLYYYIDIRLSWSAATSTSLVIMATVLSINLLFNYLGKVAVKGR